MSELDSAVVRILSEAEGWLELGNPAEALQELEGLSQAHSAEKPVLDLLWRCHAIMDDWESAVRIGERMVAHHPNEAYGWVQRSYALHEMLDTRRAYQCLEPAMELFPSCLEIPYNLACYACSLGHEPTAWIWLQKAMRLGGSSKVLRMALEDPDFLSMRPDLQRAMDHGPETGLA